MNDNIWATITLKRRLARAKEELETVSATLMSVANQLKGSKCNICRRTRAALMDLLEKQPEVAK